MKKIFLALALLATAYTASSQAFFGLFGGCNDCAPVCETCTTEVVYTAPAPVCDTCAPACPSC